MSKQSPKVLFASYECKPFYKFGGLGDVAGSLPKSLKKLDVDIRLIMPYYLAIKKNYPKIKKYKSGLKIKVAGQTLTINIYKHSLPGSRVPIYFIDSKKYFQVKNIFGNQERRRFVLFSYLVIELIKGNHLKWQPDLVHSNDWQVGIIPLVIKVLERKDIKTLFTIHNIGYAGRTKLDVMEKFGLTKKDFSQIKNNKVNIMNEAILNADKINTVSPNYASEILSREYGYDMTSALNKRKRDLSGIINGIDYDSFNPIIDKAIKVQYGLKSINKKIKNKLDLQKISNLPQNKTIPLIGMVSRLSGQKGFDILTEIFSEIMKLDLHFIVLGTGAKEYQEFFAQINKKYPDKFKAHLTFDLKLARQIYAGADMFLMPSKYEPCGLSQLIAMKYGTIPVVRSTGGLKDTVIKSEIQSSARGTKSKKNTKHQISNIKIATGFSFDNYNSQELLKIIKQSIDIYQDKKLWHKLIQNAMQKDFSWDNSAKEYLNLYNRLIK